MTITILLIPYALFLLVYLFFSIFAVYHLVKFGVQNLTTFLATFLYIALSAVILFLSATTLQEINWATPIFQGFTIAPPTL